MMVFFRLFKGALVCGLGVLAVSSGLSTLRVRASEVAKADQLWVQVYRVGDLPVWHVSAGMPARFDASLLIACIEAIVDPRGAQEGSIAEHATTQSLVIRQTKANHQRIADMIERLRAERKAVARKAAAMN